MPETDLVQVPKYDPLSPYHFRIDNLPIEGLITRIFLVNAQVDINSNILRDSVGTQGTLNNRLNQSINADGSLKTDSIDEALHSIEEHIDSNDYVRMMKSERDKLSLIEDNATNLNVEVETISNTVEWPTGLGDTISVGPSPTITWRLDGSQLVADTVVPISLQHIHVYDVTPITSDDINFTTTTVNTAYKSGTLRVYVNGLRLTESTAIGGFYFSETDPDNGTFALNSALGTGDIIRIDFDQPVS